MSQHTPGPWKSEYVANSTWAICCPSSALTAERRSEIVAVIEDRVGYNPRSEHQANAILIASAPDLLRQRDELLAACKMAFDYMCGPSVEELETQGKPIPSSEQVERAIASAIANAEGEKAKAATGVKLRDQS